MVDAQVGHGAARRLGAVGAPHARLEVEADIRGEVALDLSDPTQGPLVDEALEGAARRLPAPLVADGEDDPGPPARLRRASPVRDRQGEGLLHEHVFAVPGRGHDLLGV